MRLSTKDRDEKNKFTCIITKITLTSSLLSLAFWEGATDVWNTRKVTAKKWNTVATKYVNVASQMGARVDAESTLARVSEVNVMPTTADRIERANLSVKNSTNVKNVTKSCRIKKGSQKITYVEEGCAGIEKSLLTQIRTDVI